MLKTSIDRCNLSGTVRRNYLKVKYFGPFQTSVHSERLSLHSPKIIPLFCLDKFLRVERRVLERRLGTSYYKVEVKPETDKTDNKTVQ